MPKSIETKEVRAAKPLPPNSIEALHEERSRADTVEASIINRIDFIIITIFKTLNIELNYWQYSGDERGEYLSLDHCLGLVYRKTINQTIDFHPEFSRKETNPYNNEEDYEVLFKGESYNLLYNFPSRWLFEDFEKELLEGIEKGKESRIEKAKKEKQQQEDKEALLKTAKSKLTKAELAAIKLEEYGSTWWSQDRS